MGLSEKAQQELRSELVRLRRVISHTMEEIRAIEKVLSLSQRSTETTLPFPGQVEIETSERTGLAGLTLKEAITSVLAGAGSGMRPAEITQEMKRNGFTVEGKTPLSIRVRNELSNMKRNGELERSKDGLYSKAGTKEEAS